MVRTDSKKALSGVVGEVVLLWGAGVAGGWMHSRLCIGKRQQAAAVQGALHGGNVG